MNGKVKILIIRFSSIGDIVLTTPVIRCLKNQLEGDVEIHYVTKSSFKELLESNPYLSKIYTIEKSTNEVVADLKKENYDYIIDLHRNLRSQRIKRALKAFSFSFDKLNWQKWLLVNFKINQLPNIHIVDRYMNSCKALGIVNDNEGLDYFIKEDYTLENILDKSFLNGYTSIVLGANHATKKPTYDQYKRLCEEINTKIVLIGGKEDHEAGYELEKVDPEKIFNAAGKTSLNESAFILQNSSSVITPDTGMMHIAAAFNKKIHSIWGNTIPEFGMTPYYSKENVGNSYIYETKDLKCRPCSKIGYSKCPKGHFNCMKAIDMGVLAKRINKTVS